MIEDGNILKVSWHLKGFGCLFTANFTERWWSPSSFHWIFLKTEGIEFLRIGFLVVFVKPGDIYIGGGLYGRESSRSRAPGETKSCLRLHINKYTFTQGTYTNHCWKSFLNMLFKILHQININIDINVNTNHLRIPGHNKESTFVSRIWTIEPKAQTTKYILLGVCGNDIYEIRSRNRNG